MNIRIAGSKDIDDLVNIENKCFATPWSRNTIKREIEINDLAILIIAEEKKEVIGYMGIWFILDEGDITNVSVLPGHRRKQVATKLMDAAINLARSKKIDSLTLEVRESNYAAINLYKKFGFEKLGMRKKYYEDNGEDAIIMWKVNI